MYLGQATFYQERMNEFLNVAKSLEIKEISKAVECNVADSSQDQEVDKNIEPNIKDFHEESLKMRLGKHEEETECMSIEVISQSNDAGHPCNKCNKQFQKRGSLFRHMRSVHEGIKFPCNDCGYKATRNEDLQSHIQSVHEGIKFPCDLCDYVANIPRVLRKHKQNKH